MILFKMQYPFFIRLPPNNYYLEAYVAPPEKINLSRLCYVKFFRYFYYSIFYPKKQINITLVLKQKNQELRLLKTLDLLEPLLRFELRTPALQVRCSGQLS